MEKFKEEYQCTLSENLLVDDHHKVRLVWEEWDRGNYQSSGVKINTAYYLCDRNNILFSDLMIFDKLYAKK